MSSSSRPRSRTLEHHDEVRQRCLLDLRRDTELEARAPVIAAIDIMSMYSRINGATPLATIFGTAAAISPTVRNGASTVAACARRG